MNRRQFVIGSLATTAVAACGSKDTPIVASQPVTPTTPKPAAKKILVLGGTGFLGPHIVRAALARGHTLTLPEDERAKLASSGVKRDKELEVLAAWKARPQCPPRDRSTRVSLVSAGPRT